MSSKKIQQQSKRRKKNIKITISIIRSVFVNRMEHRGRHSFSFRCLITTYERALRRQDENARRYVGMSRGCCTAAGRRQYSPVMSHKYTCHASRIYTRTTQDTVRAFLARALAASSSLVLPVCIMHGRIRDLRSFARAYFKRGDRWRLSNFSGNIMC